MELKLHANATTTPRTRAYIQQSTAPVTERENHSPLASAHGVADRSHTPHRLAISLKPREERLVVELRTSLDLPLDDIVEVMRRCPNPTLSRSAIHRCLKRHGISARPQPAKPAADTFETASIGFLHITEFVRPSSARNRVASAPCLRPANRVGAGAFPG